MGFFFQAEDGIRDAQESRGLGDVYKRQVKDWALDQVKVANSQYFELSMGGRTERKKSPYHLSLIHI